MITSSDLIRLPYTPDLTEGGIAHALRTLPYRYSRTGNSSFNRLRRTVAGAAVELAFRRYLGGKDIPFEVKEAPPFTDPERYDVLLGGQRCDIKSFLISRPDQIASMQANPGSVLEAPALVPSDRHAAEGHGEHDLYLFAFVTGLVMPSPADVKKTFVRKGPVYLLHIMPRSWVHPRNWSPLGPLALKSESNETLTVELAGQDETRGFLTRRVELPPRTRLVIDDPFFSLSSVHVDRPLGSRLGIHNLGRDETCIVNGQEWGNIWIHGKEILLAGYIARRDFRDRAIMIQPGSHVFQFDGTRASNLAVPVSSLRPLAELFETVKAHERLPSR